MSVSQLLAIIADGMSFVAVAIYFYVLVRRPKWIRLLNGSGLLFAGIALFQTPYLLAVNRGAAQGNVEIIVVLLTLIVAVLGYAALRNRQAWDGQDRRQGWDGQDRRSRPAPTGG